jgi:hypothetical protein
LLSVEGFEIKLNGYIGPVADFVNSAFGTPAQF